MLSKPAKTPPLSDKTRLLCFDIETNGLHGEAFAVGAVVMGADGTVHEEFTARCPISAPPDEWVKEHVLPVIKDLPQSHGNARDIREAFWRWYLRVEPSVDYVLVSNGYPVEYRFLLRCQEEDLEARYWQHPFPILDLSSLLLVAGEEPTSKSKLLADITEAGKYSRHHPLHDAIITAKAAFQAFRAAGRIR